MRNEPIRPVVPEDPGLLKKVYVLASLLDDDDLFTEPDAPVQPVLSLFQVASGWSVIFPTTVYLTDSSSSSVVGVLYPDGRFIVKTTSRVGVAIEAEDEWGELFILTTIWDTSAPEPVSPIPIGYLDEGQSLPMFQGHSKGLLREHYPGVPPEAVEQWAPYTPVWDGHERRVVPRPAHRPLGSVVSGEVNLFDVHQQMNSSEQRSAEIADGGYLS